MPSYKVNKGFDGDETGGHEEEQGGVTLGFNGMKDIRPAVLPPIGNQAGSEMDHNASVAGNTTAENGKHAHVQDSEQPVEEVHSKSKEPLLLCSLIAKHPKKAFGVTLSMHLSILVITGILFISGYDILPTNFTDVPLDLNQDEVYLRGEAWVNRDEDPSLLYNHQGDQNITERSLLYEYIEIQYDLESQDQGNVLTKEHLLAIEKAERELQQLEGYSRHCLLTPNGTCTPPKSIIQFFDGTFLSTSNELHDPEYDHIPSVLEKASRIKVTASALHFHMGKESTVDNSSAVSLITRSAFFLGYPSQDGDKATEDFLLGPFRSKLYQFADSSFGKLRFTFISRTLYTEDINTQVLIDQALAIGSVGFIYIFMCFQTRSFFVATFAIFSIITSFCGANMIYRIIFDYKYFGIFHVLSVFIILGIGADDIFVFYDHWRHTSFNKYQSFAHRLSDCYRKAAAAMLVTSLTTMIAFFANALSPLLSVSTFGLFSGLLVFVNYLSVITYFPTVVAVYHIHWEQLPCCRCCCSTKTSSVDDVSESEGPRPNPPKPNALVRAFRGPFYQIVSHKVIRWIILTSFAALLAFSIYQATLLKPDSESVKIFKPESNYGRATYNQLNAFRPSVDDDIVKVYLVWGMVPQDRSSCHKSDFEECVGETKWDEHFDLNPAPAQKALMRLCHTLKSMNTTYQNKLKVRRNDITDALEIKCFMDEMQSFLQNELEQPGYTGIKYPSTGSAESVTTLMKANPHIYGTDPIDTDWFYRYFETGVEFWLNDGYMSGARSDVFSPLIGLTFDAADTDEIGDTGLYYGARLRYAAIVINTTLPFGNLGFEEGLPIMDEWENLMNREISKMPPSLSGGFQCTPLGPPGAFIQNQWHWLKVQKTLVSGATRGMAIGICLSFPVLVLATKNVIVGFLATFTIGCITVTVIGLIPLAGWKLGVLESLNLSLVVGLAVDYVVHLAEGYHASEATDRRGRVRDMLTSVGISVTSGAVTTLGASLFMLFAKILFFMQFGLFMFGTIGFSLLYSLGMFTTVLALIGPQGNVGSLKPIFKTVQYWYTGRKKSDATCGECDGKGFHKSD